MTTIINIQEEKVEKSNISFLKEVFIDAFNIDKLIPYKSILLSISLTIIYFVLGNPDILRLTLPITKSYIFQIFTSILCHWNLEHLLNNVIGILMMSILEISKNNVMSIFFIGGIGGNLATTANKLRIVCDNNFIQCIGTNPNAKIHYTVIGASGGVYALFGFFCFDVFGKYKKIDGINTRYIKATISSIVMGVLIYSAFTSNNEGIDLVVHFSSFIIGGCIAGTKSNISFLFWTILVTIFSGLLLTIILLTFYK
jgi:membrane associated rhomboid family serine protease